MAKIERFYKATIENRTTFHRTIFKLFQFYGCNFKSTQQKECKNLMQKFRNSDYKYQFDFAFVERFFFETVYISKDEFEKLTNLTLSPPYRFDISEFQGNEKLLLEALGENETIEVSKYSIVGDSFSFSC